MGAVRQPKNIGLFSDGTGNSSAKLFKTNVWRLHQAVDKAPPASPQDPLQIVAYDDGVGTSSFKPLALLGGAFGVGLKRNVLELYQFVCRNYEPGDRIYAFGFSRGAFTIRVLVALLTTIGIIDARTMDHALLDRLSQDAYRRFRRSFRLSGNRQPIGQPTKSRRDLTDLLVTRLRNYRDRRIERRRKKAGLPTLGPEHIFPAIPDIAFVGVWDTVAAYGSPVAEITKGIDRWVWPLSMPDYTLSEKVQRARHALALDDERDTFHPLLWDEVHERKLVASGKVGAQRLRQVWFAGMHSDVGGGYPDDSLAYVSLVWMAKEAASAGLRLQPNALALFVGHANPFGPIHNSRAGMGAYYRYQPRKISARLARPDRTTRLLQDPDFKGRGLLTEVRIHDSVFERIEDGTDGYAPIVLPRKYAVEAGSAREHRAFRRSAAQEKVWDRVWRRRVNYFLTLGLSFGLVILGLLPAPASTCIGPQCVVSPWLRALGEFLPAFASRWVDAYAARPGVFLFLAAGVVLLLLHTRRMELELRDFMRRLFRLSLSSQADAGVQLRAAARGHGCVRRLRRSRRYQTSMQFLKWRAAPGVAAAFIYAVSALAAVTLLSSVLNVAHRTHLALSEHADAFCRLDSTPEVSPPINGERPFETSDMCWRSEMNVIKDKRYRLQLIVDEPWSDGMLPTSPAGFPTERFRWWLRWPATLLLRSPGDSWFQPLVHVDGHTLGFGAFQSVAMKLVDYERQTYVGEFTAPAGGSLILSVNDAVFLWGGHPEYFYTAERTRNRGTASVTLEDCSAGLAKPCEY
jgi:hypothetical protein